MKTPANPSNEIPISLAALRGISCLMSIKERRSDDRPGVTAPERLPHFLDLHLVRVEGEMAGDLAHRGEGGFVGPDRVVQRLAVGLDAVIARIALVRAM